MAFHHPPEWWGPTPEQWSIFLTRIQTEPVDDVCKDMFPYKLKTLKKWAEEVGKISEFQEAVSKKRDTNLVPGPKPGANTGRKAWDGPTDEQWEDLLTRTADGENARDIVRNEWNVSYDAFLAWRQRTEGAEESFNAAILARVETMQFEILQIADDDSGDMLVGPKGGQSPNPVSVSRDKLKIDTRQFVMRNLSAKFRDKQEVDVTSQGKQIGQEMDDEAILIAADVIKRKREAESP